MIQQEHLLRQFKMLEKLIILAIIIASKRLLAQLERLIEKIESLFK